MMSSNITAAPKHGSQTPPPSTVATLASSCSTSIIPSSDPLLDANTLLNLLPGRFTLESTSGVATGDNAALSNTSLSSPSTPSGQRRSQRDKDAHLQQQSQQPTSDPSPSFVFLVSECEIIMFVKSDRPVNGDNGNNENVTQPQNIPNATLVLENLLIDSVVAAIRSEDDGEEDSGKKKCRLLMCQTSSSSSSTLASITFPGGGVILLISNDQLATTEKRVLLAQAIVMDVNGFSNSGGGGAQTAGMMERQLSSGEFMDVDLDARLEENNAENLNRVQVQPPLPPSTKDKKRSIGGGENNGNIAAVIPPPPKFSSLSLGIMSNDGKVEPGFQINSRVGIPMETDLFVGKCILLMKPDRPEDDLYYHEKLFSKKKRRFEIRLQGKLKYKPKGILYAGAEVTEQMKLGLVSKGLCSILLKLVSKISDGMHHSFGDSKGEEWAHIVFPAWTFFDRVVVTKPGETPPPIDVEYPESDEARKARKALGSTGDWNTEDTYSLSFNSMYLDLPTWHLVNLKVMKDVDLRQFWGDSMMRIVVYEKAGNPSEAKHLKKNNKYLSGLQAQYLGVTGEDGTNIKVESVDSLPWDKTRPTITRSVQSYSDLALAVKDDIDDTDLKSSGSSLEEEKLDIIEDVDDGKNDGDDDSETSVTQFFDARESTSRTYASGLEVEAVFIDETSTLTNPTAFIDEQPRTLYESILKPDLLCPAWIEMCASKGAYTKVYAFTAQNSGCTVFRTDEYFADMFAADDARALMEGKCSPRASSSERLRRYMGSVLSQPTKNIQKFFEQRNKYDRLFLRRPKPSSPKVKNAVSASCFVARALSERHWVEEWAVVTSRYISFYYPESKRPRFRICLRGFVAARKLSEDNKPNFPTHHFLEIETLGRTIYLMFLSESERDHWLSVLSRIHSVLSGGRSVGALSTGSRSSMSKVSEMDSLLAFDDPSDEFLHKSTVWSCKNRRILNCRNLVFTSLGQSGIKIKKYPPNELAEDTLKKALEPMESSEEGNLRAFLDSASALKTVNVSDMNESERLAFFLNLYHIMVMHAFLVLGIPDSSFKWASYFNMISYQCSDDIFSLTELEHNIIRANMSYPSQFVAKFVLPKSVFDFAIKRSDYRINFALNCGSLSNPRIVPVYCPETIGEQLDEATRWYLRESVKITKNGKESVLVTLPKICQWYAADFGRGQPIDIVCLLKKYLDQNVQDLLPDNLSENDRCCTKKVQNAFKWSAITVKHLQYNYKCRFLTLLQDFS